MATKIEFSTKDVNYITREYKAGWGLRAIADEFGVSIPTIRRVLTDNGITIRRRGRQVGS